MQAGPPKLVRLVHFNMPETDLYLPVKRHLEAQGYTVKAEVKGCDVVAVRGEEIPVIVELKQAMSLALLYQAVDRLTIAEHVYIAINRPKRGVTVSAIGFGIDCCINGGQR
jgi:hypothetical protein